MSIGKDRQGEGTVCSHWDAYNLFKIFRPNWTNTVIDYEFLSVYDRKRFAII